MSEDKNNDVVYPELIFIKEDDDGKVIIVDYNKIYKKQRNKINNGSIKMEVIKNE